MYAGLFEQFLNFATPETKLRSEPSSAERDASTVSRSDEPIDDTRDTVPSEKSVSAEQSESGESTAEEEAKQGAVEDQIAILTASTTTSTTVSAQPDEESSQELPIAQIVDEQLSAEQGEGEDAQQGALLIAEDVTHAVETTDEPVELAAVAEETQLTADATDDPGDERPKQLTTVDAAQTDVGDTGDTDLETSESAATVVAETKDESPVNLVESEQATSPADSREQGRHRGEERSKWYDRGHEEVALSQAADESSTTTEVTPNEATLQTETIELAAGSQPSRETGTSQHPSSTPALENVVALVGGAVAVGESVTTNIVGSHTSTNLIGDTTGSDARMSTEGVDTSRPATRVNSSEPKEAAPPTQRADALTQAERARLVQRVSRSFARLGPTGGQINIRLHPPQLGSLNVQVRMEGRSMTAKLLTESNAARDAILESLPILRGRLAEQGFEIASFQVEVADNHADVTNNNQQSPSNQADGGNEETGRQVDYRRIASMHRHPMDSTDQVSHSSLSGKLAWQSLSGIDMQA